MTKRISFIAAAAGAALPASCAAMRTIDPGWYQQPRGTSVWRVDSMSTTPVQQPATHEGHGQ